MIGQHSTVAKMMLASSGACAILVFLLLADLQPQLNRNLGMDLWLKSHGTDDSAAAANAIERLSVTSETDSTGRWVLGNSYWAVGDRGQAVASWHVESAGPRAIDLAAYYIGIDEHEVAADWLDKAVSIGGCGLDVAYLRGVLAARSRVWDVALARFAAGLEEEAGNCNRYGYSDLRYEMAFILKNRIEPAREGEAIDLLRIALEKGKFSDTATHANAYFILAATLFSPREAALTGTTDEVIALLDSALTLNPDHSWAHLLLARALVKSETDSATALAHFQQARALDKSGNWQFSYYLARLKEDEGETAEAIRFYRETLLAAPGQQDVQKRLDRLLSAEAAIE